MSIAGLAEIHVGSALAALRLEICEPLRDERATYSTVGTLAHAADLARGQPRRQQRRGSTKTRRRSQDLQIAFFGDFADSGFVIAGLHSKSIRSLSAACLALWLLAFVTCSLHCTLGSLSAKSTSAHSCCAEQSQKSDGPVAPLAKGNCHTFRDLTVADSGQLRVEFVPQFVAVIAPFLVSWTTVPVTVEERPFRPEPEMEPSSHLALMRLAGRAPPALV